MSKTTYNIHLKGYVGGYDFDRATVDKELAKNDGKTVYVLIDSLGGSLAQRNIVLRNTINRFLDAMPQNDDCLVVFDVNLRQGFYNKEILCNSIKRCNILKINDE